MSAINELPVSSLKPRALLNDLLWLDERILLLTRETPVTESLIRNLKNWEFQKVFTRGTMTDASTPAVEEIANATVLSIDAEAEENLRTARELYEDLHHFITDTYTVFNVKKEINLQLITEMVSDLIVKIKECKQYVLQLSGRSGNVENIFIHSICMTTVIAILIGESLKIPMFRLIELGVAGVLHKIGMMKIPYQTCIKLYNKKSKLNELEEKLFKAHPILGKELLTTYFKRSKSSISPDIPLGIAQYQEREDGSGSPLGIKGVGISLIGKVLAVASVYTARISKKAYKVSLNPHSVMLLMMQEIGTNFDEAVIKALLKTLSLYPPGTYIALDNNAIGVVQEINPKDLKSPIVKLLLDKNLNRLKDPLIVDTHEENSLSIVSALSNQQISSLQANNLLL